jgi:hypothetical protein
VRFASPILAQYINATIYPILELGCEAVTTYTPMASLDDSPLFLRQKISTGPRVPNTFAFFANVCACPPPPIFRVA